MHDYRKLRVYQQALDLAADVYRLVGGFPVSERYGLASQMTRAGVSVASNIAEGAGRGDDADFARYLRIARGSVCELGAHVAVAERVGIIDEPTAETFGGSVERLKAGLTKLEQSKRSELTR